MHNEEWITGKINLNISGKSLEMQMTVPVKPVKPQRMLPIFQQMTNSFVEMSVREAESAGRKISCKAGCGACCRQAVPIAEIEAYQIAELVEEMEEPRRTEIKKRFADACGHFDEIKWFERIENCARMKSTESPEAVEKELESAVLEYFYQNIPCPFLENESCSIHESRPLVCREYLVTSPAENCARPTAETIKKVDLTAKPSKTLLAVGRTELSAFLGFVPLIRALEIAEKYPENFPEKSGQKWVSEFFENLTKTEIPEKGIPPKPNSKPKKRAKKRSF
jgi:Fe-S-cluster containining protein